MVEQKHSKGAMQKMAPLEAASVQNSTSPSTDPASFNKDNEEGWILL